MSQRLNSAGIWTPSVCLSTVRFRWELCRITDKWCQCWSSNRLPRDARRRGSEDEELPGREYKEKLENRKRLARKMRRRKQGILDKGGKQRKPFSSVCLFSPSRASDSLVFVFLTCFVCCLFIFDLKVSLPSWEQGHRWQLQHSSLHIVSTCVTFLCVPWRGSHWGQPLSSLLGLRDICILYAEMWNVR